MNNFEAQLALIDAWKVRGDLRRALQRCRDLSNQAPEALPVLLKLVELAVQSREVELARETLVRLSTLAPDDPEVCEWQEKILGVSNANLVRSQDRSSFALGFEDTLPRKINLLNQFIVKTHRSGWQVAISALYPLHNPEGILFDGFIESNFAWRHPFAGRRPQAELEALRRSGRFEKEATSEERGVVPYTRPWIGWMHNPPNMPGWFHPQETPQVIFAKEIWKRSAEHCLGLFTLSEYFAAWLRETTGLPVQVIPYPTEFDVPLFSMQRFSANPARKIVQVGWWLRELSAIYRLPLPKSNPGGYHKVRLVTQFFENAHNYLHSMAETEIKLRGLSIPARFAENTSEMAYLDNHDYDALLQENIVFLSLYDVSGCTVLTECIARATPILVNPHPAVVEYLGQEYPFYYDTLEQAAAKALDFSLVEQTHHYLATLAIRERMTPDAFRTAFASSEIYQSIRL